MKSFKFALPALLAAAAISFAVPAFAQTAPAPAMAPAMAPAKPMATTKTGMAKLPASQKFTTVATAQSSCPGDTVVWSTLSTSKSFHMSNSKYYGKTKHGAYVCEKAAMAAGYHPAKT